MNPLELQASSSLLLVASVMLSWLSSRVLYRLLYTTSLKYLRKSHGRSHGCLYYWLLWIFTVWIFSIYCVWEVVRYYWRSLVEHDWNNRQYWWETHPLEAFPSDIQSTWTKGWCFCTIIVTILSLRLDSFLTFLNMTRNHYVTRRLFDIFKRMSISKSFWF